jgi:hypothetical protein
MCARSSSGLSSLSQAEEENGQQSLSWNHWSFDKTEVSLKGRVADYVFANTFTPIPAKKSQ